MSGCDELYDLRFVVSFAVGAAVEQWPRSLAKSAAFRRGFILPRRRSPVEVAAPKRFSRSTMRLPPPFVLDRPMD
jgi:hypothetical protein